MLRNLRVRIEPLLLLLFLLPSVSFASWFTPKSDSSLLIVGNINQIGYSEPCGCQKQPLGGMYRRWNAVKLFPEDRVLQFDAGNLFFPSNYPPKTQKPVWGVQAKYIVKTYNQLGLDAFCPGPTDFALGPERLKKLQKEAQFPFVSSNVYDRKSDRPLFDRSKVIRKGDITIFVTGVTSPTTAFSKDVKFRKPEEALDEVLSENTFESADMKVLLSSYNFASSKKLLETIKEKFDLVLYDDGESFHEPREIIPGTWAMTNTRKGQAVSLIEMNRASSKWTKASYALKELSPEFQQNHTGKANSMQSFINLMNSEIRKMESMMAAASVPVSNRRKRVPPLKTFMECSQCHKRQHFFQNGRAHSVAFLTLVRNDAVNKSDCLKCHSVGLKEPRGFQSVAFAFQKKDGSTVSFQEILKKAGLQDIAGQPLSYRLNRTMIREDGAKFRTALEQLEVQKAFVGVQCENCHQPDPNHPNDMGVGMLKVQSDTCLRCHTREQSPSWYQKNGKPNPKRIATAMEHVACMK